MTKRVLSLQKPVKSKTSKQRLDQILVSQGLAPSRQQAQALILSGAVLVNDQAQTKPGCSISTQAVIRIRGKKSHPYVSRGALKLEAALDTFGLSVTGKIALDVGASTGGFTDLLLSRGILRVHAIDVGHNQLHWKLRNHPQVIVQEKLNARYLRFEQIGEKVDLIVIDVSFISLKKILPALIPLAHSQTEWITLVKPQFEVGRDQVGSGGIVRSEVDRQRVYHEILIFGKTLNLNNLHMMISPLLGADGNQEFLVHWKMQERSP